MAERVYCLYRGKDQESILMQKNACHDFAEKKGWNIVGEEQEIGVSGYKVSADDLVKLQRIRKAAEQGEFDCALPGFVDSKNEEKTERNAGYLVVSHSGGGMLRQGTRKGIRRTPANRGMRAHWVVKGLDISEDVCHGMCP